MIIITTATPHTSFPTTLPEVSASASGLSRTNPANIDLPVTEPIDISAMLQLLLEQN